MTTGMALGLDFIGADDRARSVTTERRPVRIALIVTAVAFLVLFLLLRPTESTISQRSPFVFSFIGEANAVPVRVEQGNVSLGTSSASPRVASLASPIGIR
jgi:hypothetical protein